MSLLVTSLILFAVGYIISLLLVTVFYHRSIAHNAVKFRPWLHKTLVLVAPWLTGMDVKAWATMHRMHHEYSDTPRDPHSPANVGIIGVAMEQLRSYERVIAGLMKGRESYTDFSLGMDFDVSWPFRKKMWWLPHTSQAVFALAVAGVLAYTGVFTGFDAFIVTGAFWVGLMSHPIQGFLVNALAHSKGYRNYKTDDQSTNNTLVAWFVFGEGFQNNHHMFPYSPKFSIKWFEFDIGYMFCHIFQAAGLLKIEKQGMIQPPEAVATEPEYNLADSAPQAEPVLSGKG